MTETFSPDGADSPYFCEKNPDLLEGTFNLVNQCHPHTGATKLWPGVLQHTFDGVPNLKAAMDPVDGVAG